MSIVENSSGDESDDKREKKESLQCMKCFNRLFVVASSSVQLYYKKYILKQPCVDSKQSGETWIQEILDGKYYLVNSGYPKMKGYLGPYRGQGYHLPDFRRDFMEYENINRVYENIIDSENAHGGESDDDDDDDESNNSSGSEIELT
ncbi:hypothetical protein Goklo_024111, partial [Gossypium klotzschianum]|nr:hypothetical protein [Gossypium klotzschianum]